ncbi:hypothetical protein [Amycolatopsis sp. lyj-112]|uniref:hypothetical protein n=1 Tax=Amycolatopsis sp. lyj-112 TaxID=2789288 RepID=UPI00397CA402
MTTGEDVMGAPDHGRATQAEQEIAQQVKTARADTDLRANLKEPPPPPSVIDKLGMGFGAAPTGGAGYRIDPEALAAQIRTFEDIRDRSRAAHVDLMGAARNATPPSNDPPAVANAAKVRDSLAAAAANNLAILEYAQGLIDSLRKANGTYKQHDEETSALFKERPAT